MSGRGWNGDNSTRRWRPLLSALTLAALLLLFGGQVQAHPGALLEESSKRECAVCHVMWMDEFKQEVETLIPWVGDNVLMKSTYGLVSDEEMCYSCHDGYIADSRYVWTGKRHTVFEKPSEEMEIDERRFPLSVNDEIYCGTCHTIHSAQSGEVEELSYDLFLRMENPNSEMCMACHQDYDTGPAKGRHSVGEEIAQGFPGDLRELRLRPGRKMAEEVICNSCHVVHGAKQQESLLPVAAGMANFCGQCHEEQNIRQAGEGDFLAHVMDVDFDQAEFPAALEEAGARLEDEKLTCQSCHNIHQGQDEEALLVMADTRESDLCLSCHDSKKVIKDTPHNLLITDLELQLQNLNEQHVADAGLCGICHSAHGWQQEMRAGEDPATEACNTCHAPGRGRLEMELAGPYSHSVGVNLDGASPRDDHGLPLYNHDFTPGDKIYCNTCHDSHQSLGQVYGTPEGRDERGLISTRFLRIEDFTEMCSRCHTDQMVVEGANHDPRLFELEYRNIRGEKPGMSGACGACHLMHEGPEPVGFAVAPPEVTYPEAISRNPENFYCLSCHEENRVGRERLIGEISHPMGEKPEESESSEELADQEVTCLSCHDVHRWAPGQTEPGPGYLLEGDVSSSFLLVDNRGGELCAQCHRTPALVIDSDHDLSAHAGRAMELGVCEQCHAPHNAHGDRLWGRDLAGVLPDDKEQNRLCLDCHRPGEPGEDSRVSLYRHPEALLLTDPVLLARLDLSDPEKTMAAVEREFVCATCHDPHIWSRQLLAREDKVITSPQQAFLKMGDPAATFCVDCHGSQVRTKYLFYHEEKARTEDSPYYADDPVGALRELLRRFRGN
ncbi:cytochrome c3 family protein [Desulfurivibrio dismutans]|uniref:cytochrome c3 family protein n=1 Tax=Desulfurivibrio dismutans TaxID=1398908 RepID=UPI0023DC345C|nr:cytochrome c3 family protein [Desulfurivibrio alkaliphilus]MDF1613884.1 cytochrome c3 family protein [Desulfurivibrio alkaliphilus]